MRDKSIFWAATGMGVLLLAIFAIYTFGSENMQKPIYLYPMAAIAFAVVVIGIVFITLAARGHITQQEPNYRLFFIIGATWLPLGIATENPGFWGIGIVFIIWSLANRKKWEKHSSWHKLSPVQRRFKLAGVLIL